MVYLFLMQTFFYGIYWFFIESSEVKYKKLFGKHSTEYQERASPGKTKAFYV
jgi:hypothetical protein